MTYERTIALVTGASSGIGAAVAARLARDGRDLVVVARRRERLEELAARLRDDNGAAVDVLVADLTDAAGLATVAERAAGDERLDLVVNNAGFAGYGPFLEINPATAQALVAVHVEAAVRICRASLPGMVRRGSGAVVNVASMLALSGQIELPMRGRATYAGCKSFLLTFTQLLAEELAGTGVRAMVCLPGMVESELHGVGSANTLAGVPLMSADDVAQAIVVGLELGETICAPSLEEAEIFERLRETQQAVFAGTRSTTLASRYRSSASQDG